MGPARAGGRVTVTPPADGRTRAATGLAGRDHRRRALEPYIQIELTLTSAVGRVLKAEASQGGGAVRACVELRDVNYPGSTYDLRRDAKFDALSGVDFQAAQRQRIDVPFVRFR